MGRASCWVAQKRRLSGVLLVTALLGCDAKRENALSELLSSELDAPSDEIRTLSRESTAIPGLVYHWGIYMPTDMVDARHVALVAQYGDVLAPVRAPADLATLSPSIFASAPPTSSAAVTLCFEVIRETGPGADPTLPPILYDGPHTIAALESPPLKEDLAEVDFEPPHATEAAGGWVVELWVLEDGRAARYRCELGASEVQVSELDEAKGAGLIRY